MAAVRFLLWKITLPLKKILPRNRDKKYGFQKIKQGGNGG